MKRILAGLAMALLAACGGGESGDTAGAADAGSADAAGPAGDFVKFTAGPAAITYPKVQAAYHTGDAYMLVVGMDEPPTQSIKLTFPGQATGTFDCGASTTIEYNQSQTTTYAAGGGLGGSCRIVVTAAGAVGGSVEGTFSGTVVGLGGTTGSLEIKDGSFKSKRAADVP